MTSAIIWLAMEEVMHLAGSEQPKRKLCESIISRVSAKTGLDSEFGKAYQNAKNRYSSALAAVSRIPRRSGGGQK